MTLHAKSRSEYDHLNSRPGSLQYGILAGVALVIVIASVWSVINGRAEGAASPLFLGTYGGMVFVLELFSAVLLFSQFRNTGILTFGLLACAYLWVVLISPFQVALLAGAFDQVSFIATAHSQAAWLWTFWHLGFPIIVTIAMLLDGSSPIVTDQFKSWALLITGSTVAIALVAIVPTLFGWITYPVLVKDTSMFTSGLLDIIGPLNVMLCTAALLTIILKGKLANAIYAWLVIAMLATACEGVVAIYSGSRFSVGWYASRALSLVSSSAVFIALLLETMHLYHKVIKQNTALHGMASTDGLSGLANRRAFDERLEQDTQRAQRDHLPLSLILVDIDNFKQFNDTYGHPNGDRCIRHVSEKMAATINRSTDFIARFGGEEFAVILPSHTLNQALTVAEKLRTAIEHAFVELDDGSDVRVTASFGVATTSPHSDYDEQALINRADTALYQAKASGRNCVRTHQQSAFTDAHSTAELAHGHTRRVEA
ncbi:GGDEF domain-containing protein [Alteromonas antoniana]|uniref:sensor domain-containing diguanylate cyclase n=1 Tax=Alteromonas antoniana TaxID=2803813 RepID=UPI001C47A8E9|nr:sensor domain-containing diguanylate cyclase [Alteromonas antoniana]